MAHRRLSPIGTPSDPLPPAAVAPTTWGPLLRALYRHARCLGARGEEAEDLVHDVMERYCRDPGCYDARRGTLLALLKVMLRNRWLDRVRARRRRSEERVQRRLRVVSPSAAPPDRAGETRAAEARRVRFLDALSDAERALFFAWMSQSRRELNARQASASLGLAPAAYEAAKKRLRRRCAALLAELDLRPADLFAPEAP